MQFDHIIFIASCFVALLTGLSLVIFEHFFVFSKQRYKNPFSKIKGPSSESYTEIDLYKAKMLKALISKVIQIENSGSNIGAQFQNKGKLYI